MTRALPVKARPAVDLVSASVLEADLRAAQRAYERAQARLEARYRERNAAVRRALAEGWEPVEIAEAIGVSRQRAHQIIHGARNP